MIVQPSILLALLSLIDRLPLPPSPPPGRGRPPVYPERLFLKALVVMVVRKLPTVHALLAVLRQPTAEMAQVRVRLTDQGRFPSRRTWERRLGRLPASLPAQIACLGRHLVAVLAPWSQGSCAAAIDSTVLAAKGGVWHKQHRDAGIVPHSSIDTDAHWTKSGWHGWVYGYKLHLVTTVAAVWLPLAARLTPANAADNEVAPALIADLPPTLRFLLGDTSYNDADLYRQCETDGRILVASQRGPYPHTDDGVEVRRVFHQLRSHTIENFNGQFKAIFDVQGPVPTKGLRATCRFVLGAVLVYQLTLWLRFDLGLDLRTDLKPFLQAA
ncbi:MAG: transposase [Dehalococcoidia bacterium]